jgi:hypothetical protein
MFSPVIPEEGEGERGLASSSTPHNTNLLTTVDKLFLSFIESSKKMLQNIKTKFLFGILCHVSQNHRLESSVAEPKLFISAPAPPPAPLSRKSEVQL